MANHVEQPPRSEAAERGTSRESLAARVLVTQ